VYKNYTLVLILYKGMRACRSRWLSYSYFDVRCNPFEERLRHCLQSASDELFERPNSEQSASDPSMRPAHKRVPFLEVGPLAKKANGVISKTDLKGCCRRPGSVASVRRKMNSLQVAEVGSNFEMGPLWVAPTVLARSVGAISKNEG
jgi:hypothetical protein